MPEVLEDQGGAQCGCNGGSKVERRARGQVVSHRSWAFTLSNGNHEDCEQRRFLLTSVWGKEKARMSDRRQEMAQDHMRLCRCREVAGFKNI